MASEKDRFDRLPRTRGRVGAHRGPRRRGLGWLWVLLAVVVAAALTVVALYLIPILTGMRLDIPWLPQPSPTPSSTQTRAPAEITDPADIDPARGITIAVLNGTPATGLQDDVFQQLSEAGWPMKLKANAGDRDQLDTFVYVSNPADVDVARGLIQVLGYGDIRIVDPDQYPGASLTIVIGEDSPLYTGPRSTPTGAATTAP